MIFNSLKVFVALIGVVAGAASAHAAEPRPVNQDVRLSPDVLNLLRAEMREISGGVQGLASALATADWKSIQNTGRNIRASYIMEKKLTPAQADELEKALPLQFKQLDAEFHRRAEKLEAAAAARDPELVAFHYSRLVESCVQCHSAYASKRFPGFASPPAPDHSH